MENASKLNRVVLTLLLSCCASVTAGIDPGRTVDLAEHSALPFTGMAIQVANFNLVPMDSHEMRINGIYGLNYQAFLQDVQGVDFVAITTYGLGGTELTRSDQYAEVEKVISLASDSSRMTQSVYEEAQKKFLTSLADVQAFRMPDAAEAKGVAGLMPKTLDDQQLAVLRRLGNSTIQGDGDCGQCEHTCAPADPAEACDPDDTKCLAETAKTCESPEECAAQEASCCQCCCCRELALFATGASGYGAFGVFSQMGGWGGGGGLVGEVETKTKTHVVIIVPEPATYLTAAGMLAVAAWVAGARRRRQQQLEE